MNDFPFAGRLDIRSGSGANVQLLLPDLLDPNKVLANVEVSTSPRFQ